MTEAVGPFLDVEDGLWLPFGSHWSPVPSPRSLPPWCTSALRQSEWSVSLDSSPSPNKEAGRGSSYTLALQGLHIDPIPILILNALALFRKLSFPPFYSALCSSNIHCEVYSYGLIGYLFWLNLWVLLMASHCETHGPALTQPSTQPRLSEAMWPCTKVLGPACAGVSLRLK